jgi:hypothetical protein
MRLHWDGEFVHSDRELNARLAGQLDVDRSAAVAAYCVNGWYWETDVTLDLDVLVSSSERFYRVAELASDGTFRPELVAAVEQDLLKTVGGSPSLEQVSRRTRDLYGDTAIRDYLAASAEAASPASLDRYVIYAVSTTVWDQYVYVIDLERRDRAAIRRFGNGPTFGGKDEVVIAGADEPILVNQDDCRTLIDG